MLFSSKVRRTVFVMIGCVHMNTKKTQQASKNCTTYYKKMFMLRDKIRAKLNADFYNILMST